MSTKLGSVHPGTILLGMKHICCLWNHMTLWSRGLMRSRDKLKPSYLHYHDLYNHQIWQDDNFPWWPCVYDITWPFDQVALRDHVTYWNHHMSATALPIGTKLGRMVAYLDRLLPIESHDPLNSWSFKIMWQTKIIISPLPRWLWPSNLTGWWLTLTAFFS